MARWYRRAKYRYEYNGFVFEYDTATELGRMAAESKCGMPNPFDPSTVEFDMFNEARIQQRKSMTVPK